MKTEIKKLPHSEIEIAGEIPAETFDGYRAKAIAELSKNFELPGFRKGKVPEEMFLQKVPETIILEEMSEMAVNDTYPKIIEEHKLDPIGRPEVQITKLAKGNPLGFTIKTAVVPEIKLPEYRKISAGIAKEADIIVTDEETDKVIEEIRKMRAPQVEKKEGETPVESVLPELNDDFAKTLGNFQNVAEFKEKLKENIKMEKERETKEKRRIKILDALVEKSEIDLPKIIVEEEQNKLIHQLRYDVERLGMKFDEYLKNVGKTEDDIKKEWEGEAVKRAKIQFIVNEIATKEGISPSEEELSDEVKHLLEHNKDIDESRARMYFASVITNRKVMELLEKGALN